MKMQNKKVAILLVGHLRTFNNNFPSFYNNVLKNYDCDIYANTWNNLDHTHQDYFSEYDVQSSLNVVYGSYLKQINVYNFDGFMDINLQEIRNNPVQYGNYELKDKKLTDGPVSEEWINRISSQWYITSRAFENFQASLNTQYDVIFRTRFDVHYKTPFVFKEGADLFVVNPHPYESKYDTRDHLFYGNEKIIPLMIEMHQRSYETLKKFNNYTSELMFITNMMDKKYNLNIKMDTDICEYQNYFLNR